MPENPQPQPQSEPQPETDEHFRRRVNLDSLDGIMVGGMTAEEVLARPQDGREDDFSV